MGTLRDLLSLGKPRIVGLLCLTSLGGVLAAGGLSPVRTLAFLAAGAGAAGGAAALNCWYDRDLDRRMERTRDRPLPAGDLSPRTALATGLGLLAAGTAVAVAALPAVSVGFVWLGVVSYLGLYTVWLKRRQPFGVVLGGSAGAFPVLAGWTAVRPVGAAPLLMAAVVFAWTPGHAWALATVYRDDFAAAGVATLPAVASRGRVRRAVWRSAVLAVLVAAAAAAAAGGPALAGALVVAGPAFLASARRFHRTGSDPAAVRTFFDSNLLLAALFAAWGADGVVAGAAPGVALAAAVAAGIAVRALRRYRPALRGVRAPPATPLVVRDTGWWEPLALDEDPHA